MHKSIIVQSITIRKIVKYDYEKCGYYNKLESCFILTVI
jgi:hypothetical protein